MAISRVTQANIGSMASHRMRDIEDQYRHSRARLGHTQRSFPYRLYGAGGNVLYQILSDTYQGVVRIYNTPISSVPTAAPVFDTIYQDGLGYARQLDIGGGLVWVSTYCQDSEGREFIDAGNSVAGGHGFTSRMYANVNVDGGGTAKVYLPWLT